MKTPEAKLEATRRWGAAGFARCPDGLFTVGCGSIIGGQARSWDAAFAEADGNAYLAGYMRMLGTLDNALDKAATK